MDKLVSVIITAHGTPKSLGRSILSVLRQTYRNIEIIVVDDNGLNSDNQKITQSVVEKIRSSNPGEVQIRYIANVTNMNASFSRNVGVEHSKGEYIALLDDDDEFVESKIEKQIYEIEKINAKYKVCSCSFISHFPNGHKVIYNKHNISDIAYGVLMEKTQIPTSSLLFTRESFYAVNGFDISFSRHQDWEFVVRLSQISKFCFSDEIGFYKHIQRRNTTQYFERAVQQREFYFRKMKPHLIGLGKNKISEIENHHNLELSVLSIKHKKVMRAFHYFMQINGKLNAIHNLFQRITHYLFFTNNRGINYEKNE